MSSKVVVLGTGGTIASTDGDDGATPSRSGTELVDAVPGIETHADLDVREVVQTPSFDIDPDDIAAVARGARDAAAEGATGVVVTHGTDTMEESAYYLDLVLDLPIPVVLTGAQRRPDEVSPDGPSNLLTAVRAATSEHLAGAGGVYVAFDEELHAARDVTKAHTSALSTFVSPDACPIVRFTREGERVLRAPGSRSVTLDVTETSADVEMVKTGVGVGARQLRAALDAGVDGIVVEGTGLGNTTGALGDAIADAVDAGTPVVLTSRCHAGAVAPVYGTSGGGETLHRHGVISGDDLPAHKARVKLMLALAASDGDGGTVRDAFA
ncbi:asparaginase [Halarchaeum nitratireducens]|nr:asparaginase [Halarchaeum nitratireducens]